MVPYSMGNISAGNKLVSDETKSLPEPILTRYESKHQEDFQRNIIP